MMTGMRARKLSRQRWDNPFGWHVLEVPGVAERRGGGGGGGGGGKGSPNAHITSWIEIWHRYVPSSLRDHPKWCWFIFKAVLCVPLYPVSSALLLLEWQMSCRRIHQRHSLRRGETPRFPYKPTTSSTSTPQSLSNIHATPHSNLQNQIQSI